MIYVNFPVGGNYGWGVCGKYVSREIARLAPTRLICQEFNPNEVGDEIEFASIKRLVARQDTLSQIPTSPLLQSIAGAHMAPTFPEFRSCNTVGYTFFEENHLRPAAIETARNRYRTVATGSSWCTQILREHGLSNVATVLQGVDQSLFHPLDPDQRLFPDNFVVFSGGKFELRKGQDIVIRAFKVLADRHPDALLVTAWFNHWPESWSTMKASKLIRFGPTTTRYFDAINETLAANGIDPARTIHIGPRPNSIFPKVYRNTDVGLFPNRCEGGTNLVLMEYMACARPVIATSTTGHADVVHHQNALMIGSTTSTTHRQPDGFLAAEWPEPNLDETIGHLEFAYQNREKIRALAQRGAADMQRLSWSESARQFLALLSNQHNAG